MAAMDVEETKQLILRRLDEMRQVRPAPRAEPAPQPATPRPERSKARRPGGWFGGHAQKPTNDLGQRVIEIEDRLAAVERCFLELKPQGQRRSHMASPDQASAQPRGAAERPGEAAAAHPVAKGLGSAAAKTHGFDFGGQPYRLTGVAGDGLMTDVLQLLASNQKNGRFSLFIADSQQRFDTFFKNGEIIHVVAGDLQGDAAFFAMMATAQEAGYYGFLEEAALTVAPTINAKTEFLILEALRRIDEDRNKKSDAGKGQKG